jgi:transposase
MEQSTTQVSENQADVVGVDLGIKNLATLSNGETIEGRKPRKLLSRRLARLQRHLAKCTRGSKRYSRQKMKIARLHYRISCIRHDGLHKLTHHQCPRFIGFRQFQNGFLLQKSVQIVVTKKPNSDCQNVLITVINVILKQTVI